MSDQHPLIAEHLAKFGVAHTSLGRNLRGNRKTADNDPIVHSGDEGPISHADQEKRLGDSKMWVPHRSFEPAKAAVQGASGYASKIHLPDPHARSYAGIKTSTGALRDIGRAYDALPTRDASAIPHFERMRKEIGDQHDHMTNAMGIKTEVTEHDPYPTVHHMVQDVMKNKRIKVLSTKLTGGHDFLSDEDNDKFRAIHDVFGHAATGRGFDAHGEEAAWMAHSQMFTPHARGAMSSETRGQNSALHINGSFQAQKTALLPRHMWDDTAVSKHLSTLSFEAFLTKSAGASSDPLPGTEGADNWGQKWSREADSLSDKAFRTGDPQDHKEAKQRHHFMDNYPGLSDERKQHHTDMSEEHQWAWRQGMQTPAKVRAYQKGADKASTLSEAASDWTSHANAASTHQDAADLAEKAGMREEFKTHQARATSHRRDSLRLRREERDGKTSALQTVAHDSGDGETIYHCPFCGSGQVLARSDRTIECEFCHTCFTVQVQPQYPAFPQTVNGMPVQVPGMPGQVGVDPAGAGGPPMDPNDPAAGGDDANPFASSDDASADPAGDDSGGNPFAKGSALLTTAGKALPVDSYLAHLALKHTKDRDTTLAAVKQSRRG